MELKVKLSLEEKTSDFLYTNINNIFGLNRQILITGEFVEPNFLVKLFEYIFK